MTLKHNSLEGTDSASDGLSDTASVGGKQVANLDEFIQEIIAPFSIHRAKYARPHGTVARRQFANRMKKRLLGAGLTDLELDKPLVKNSPANPPSGDSPKPSNELSKLLDELFINYSDPTPKIKLKAALQKHIDERVIVELESLDKKYSPEGLGFIEIDEEEAIAILRNRIKSLKPNNQEEE